MVSPKNNGRASKIDTYLNCAEVFAYRSTCLKRKYEADNYTVIPANELKWLQD